MPEPGPGEVLIAVSAASLNFGDIARCRGHGRQRDGPGALHARHGRRAASSRRPGAGAEEWIGQAGRGDDERSRSAASPTSRSRRVTGVFDAPPELDDVEAAAFTLPFHTGYLALHRRAQLQAGETLLVVGGASAVGTAVIQLGAAAGARRDRGRRRRREGRAVPRASAPSPIDHQTEDLFDRVMELTDGHGADVVRRHDRRRGHRDDLDVHGARGPLRRRSGSTTTPSRASPAARCARCRWATSRCIGVMHGLQRHAASTSAASGSTRSRPRSARRCTPRCSSW